MALMTKEQRILRDFLEPIKDFEVKEQFASLYENEREDIKRVFAYFHQSFNALFDFLNYKKKGNGHYNANESRELDSLIGAYEDLKIQLGKAGVDIEINSSYQAIIDACKNFLSLSGGSAIPDDFKPIDLIKHDPILTNSITAIDIRQSGIPVQLQSCGEGAFATVHKYKDEFYKKKFALKKAKRNISERDLLRFEREFRIMRELRSPHVLEVYDYDAARRQYTMEYCSLNLEKFIDKYGPGLRFEEKKDIALQFLSGLKYLHQKELLHRDISYRNALVKIYEFEVMVKLSDFGLVKEEGSEFTQSDTDMKGSIRDPCLDSFKNYKLPNEIYAIGFILHFIFTGKQHLHIGNRNLDAIITKCTDRTISKRYSCVDEIIVDVEELQDDANPAGNHE